MTVGAAAGSPSHQIGQRRDSIRRARYIRARRWPLTLGGLARYRGAQSTPQGLQRLFHRHTGTNFSAYVARLRIGQACALLSGSERPIAHIAGDVGYDSLANFNRQFKALKAMTPRLLRRPLAVPAGMTPGAAPPRRTPRGAIIWRVASGPLLIGLVLLASALHRAPSWLGLYYVVLGVTSAGVYWYDKHAAVTGGWRVRETRLHGLDLIGGVVGGLFAQVALRHKTAKPEFGFVSAVIAILHTAVAGALACGVMYWPAILA